MDISNTLLCPRVRFAPRSSLLAPAPFVARSPPLVPPLEQRVYTPDTETSIGVNLNQLAKALRCADDGDRVVLLSDSDPRVGRIYIYIYRPNSSCPEDQSFFKHLYDEGSFMDCFHNGDPNRRLRVRLKKRDVPADQLPTKEMVFDLPKVFVDEPAIGVPPTPPGYTMRIPSTVFRDITSHLTTLADTLDISLFLEQTPHLDNLDDLPDVDPDFSIKIRHKVVFSSTYDVDYNGRHELRSKLRWAGIEEVLDLTEGASDDAICVAGASKSPEDIARDLELDRGESDDEACDIEPGEKPTPLLLITQSFAARYLSTFAAAEEINDVVELYMNEDAPIQVRYVQDGLKMVYFLAPKIDE